MEPLEKRLVLSANLNLIQNGLPDFLSSLQNELNAVVFTAPAPLIGNQLTSEQPGQFPETVAAKLGNSWLVANPSIENVKSALHSQLGGWIDGVIGHSGDDNSDSIQFQLTLVHTIETTEDTEKFDVDLALGADPMIDPRLGIEDQVDVSAKWTVDLTFGVNSADGFYISTAAADELTVDLTATLPDTFEAKGIVGVFGALIEADGPSTISTSYTIDMADADGDHTLLVVDYDYPELTVDATLDGFGTVNLDVDASFIPDFVADADRTGIFNLVVTADAAINYSFSNANTQPTARAGEEPVGQFGDPVVVQFDNVTLNLAKFFAEFVDPVIRKIQEPLEPLKPVVDFLTDPVPVLSDLSGDDVTVLDLAATVADAGGQSRLKEGIENAKTVITFIDGILEFPVPFAPTISAGYEKTRLGAFEAEVEPPKWDEYLEAHQKDQNQDNDGYLDDTDPRPKKMRKDELSREKAYQDAKQGLKGAGQTEKDFFTKFDAQIQFPFLSDPSLVAAMLMGDTTVDLVTFGIGFEFGFEFEYSYPIIPGLLNADFGFTVEAALRLGAGYDMFGVAALSRSLDFSDQQQLEVSVDGNLYRLADGFYFDDHNSQNAQDGDIDAAHPDNPAKDQPELTLSATMTAGASIGPKLGPFRAVVGVNLDFGAHIFFDLNDLPEPEEGNPEQADYVHDLLEENPTPVPQPDEHDNYDYDGRVRIGEMQLIAYADPAGIFNYSGALTVGMDVYATVKLKIGWFECTLIDVNYELFKKVIFEFNIYQLEDFKVLKGERLKAPVIGNLDANGTLSLHMGETANLRKHTGPDGEDESPPVTRESFAVKSLGNSQEGEGETLEVTFQAWESEIDPATGAPKIDDESGEEIGQWVARGKETFHNVEKIEAFAGSGDDRILVDDTVAAPVHFEGGEGNDLLSYAGKGAAQLLGNGGNDKLLGGSANDMLDGGPGDDQLLGGDGDDTQIGGAGKDRLDGQAGLDDLTGGSGPDTYVWRVGTGIDTFHEDEDLIPPPDEDEYDHISIQGATQVIQTKVRDGASGVIELDDQIELIGNGEVTVRTSGGTIIVDNIESIGVAAGGGADKITLHNLGHTEVEQLSVDLSSPDETDQTDGDTVIVAGSESETGNADQDNDKIAVWGGLEYKGEDGEIPKEVVRISHTTGTTKCEAVILNSDPARDRLEVRGDVGDDTLTVASGEDGVHVQDLIAVTLNGGQGDDTLTTVYSDVEIFGGDGQDDLTVMDDINSNQTAYIDLGDRNVAVFLAEDATVPDHLISYSGVENELKVMLENPQRTVPRAGNDVRVLSTTARPVTILGGTDDVTIDQLIIPRSRDTNGLSGELKYDVASELQTVSGLGYTDAIAYSGLERLTLDLGSGNDEVTVWSTGAETTNFQGNNGDDTVRLPIETPISPDASPLGNLTFSIEKLVVQHVGDEAVAWRVEEGSVFVDQSGEPLKIVDASGADRVIFEGGPSGQDSLAVVNTGRESQTVTLKDNTVFVQPESQVLSFNTLTLQADPGDSISGIVESSQTISDIPAGAAVTEVVITVDIERASTVTHDQIDDLIAVSLALGDNTSPIENPLLVDQEGHSILVTRLSAFNGSDPNGDWTLRIENTTGEPIGTLSSWTLQMTDDAGDYLDDPLAGSSPILTSDQEYMYAVGPLDSGESVVRTYWRNPANGQLSLIPDQSELFSTSHPLGDSVAIDGDLAVVGAGINEEGRLAHVFERDKSGKWTEISVLSVDGVKIEEVPPVLAISGNTVIVGVDYPLAAYVFERADVSQQWTEGEELIPDDGSTSETFFGVAVAISGNTAVVGVSGANSAYIFEKDGSGWDQQHALSGHHDFSRQFGASVAISGQTAFIGAPGSDSAYIFEKNGSSWSEGQMLTGSGEIDSFGRAVAVAGDAAIVGAPQAGLAYVFEKSDSEWDRMHTLAGYGQDDDFGNSVAISGNTAVVGAAAFGQPGSVSVFEENDSGYWILIHTLTDDTPENSDQFGRSVAVDGNTVIIAEPSWSDDSDVHAFEIAGVGASSIAVSADNQYLYVARPYANSTLSVYRREADSVSLTTVQTVVTAEDPVVTISPDGRHVYVTGFGEVMMKYDRDADTGELKNAVELPGNYGAQRIVFDRNGSHAYVTSVDFNEMEVFQRDTATGDLTPMDPRQVFKDGMDGIEGLDEPVALALSPDEEQRLLYVAGQADDAIAIFSRRGSGELTFKGYAMENTDGVSGLRGVASLVVTENYLFAVSEEDDSLVAFNRGTDGLLTFAQRLTNGDGIEGLENPNSVIINPDGNWLYVTSAGEGGRPGGVAWFGVQQEEVWPAAPLVVGYSGIEGLTIQTGNESDRVSVRGLTAGLNALNVGTSDGDDRVLVQQSPENVTATFRLGIGADELDLRSTAQGATTEIYGEAGNDTIHVWSTGANSTTTIEGDDGDDEIRVAVDAFESDVIVYGGSSPASSAKAIRVTAGDLEAINVASSLDPGDKILYDPGEETVATTGTIDGSIEVQGKNVGVQFYGIGELAELDAPSANANKNLSTSGPYTVQEGQSLMLLGSADLKGQLLVSAGWDVDGDNDFGDLTGFGPHTLAWSDLRRYGLDDDGVYEVALRVETHQGFDIDTAAVTIANVDPILNVSSVTTSVDQFTPYALNLTAIDPGNDSINEWLIDWGDGIVGYVAGSEVVATHTYAPGTYTVLVHSATDEDGTYTVNWTEAVTVEAVELLSGANDTEEGQTYELTLSGSPGFGNSTWTVDWGDGSEFDPNKDIFHGSPGDLETTLTHEFLDDSGAGTFTIQATIQTDDGILTETINVAVANVEPQLKIAGRSSIEEGSSYTLYLLAKDPGDDTISSWTIDWGDGSNALTIAGSSKTISHRYADDGVFSIQVTATDEDYSVGEPYHTSQVAWLDRKVFRFNAGRGKTGNFYTLTAQSGTWDEVATEAFQLGGHLATITTGYEMKFPGDGQEQEFLDERFFDVFEPPERLWIDGVVLNNLVWTTTQESMVYENWVNGRPSEGSSVAMVRSSDPTAGEPLSRWIVTEGDESLFGIVELSSIDKLVSWSTGSELQLTVEDSLPRVALDGPTQVKEGSSFTLSIGVPIDPGGDKVTQYLIDWGDGSEVQTLDAPDSDGFAYEQTASHVYEDDGSYQITIQLVDAEDGTSANDTGFMAHVVNVKPVLTMLGASDVDEGSAYMLTLDSVFDPGSDAIDRYVVHWGDGNVESFSSLGEITHVYYGGAQRTIAVDVEDEDGIYSELAKKSVTVNDVQPTIALSGDDEVETGAVYTLTLGEVTDPGQPGSPVSVNEYLVHWGDGSSDTYTEPGDVTHRYRDGNFRYTISANLTIDGDTFSDAGRQSVMVEARTAAQGSLSGYVYMDGNNNSVHDVHERGIPGVIIELTGESVVGESIAMRAMTADDGSYKFVDLAPGSYSIVENQPLAFVDGSESSGIQGSTTSDDMIEIIDWLASEEGRNNNFGEVSMVHGQLSVRHLLASTVMEELYRDANANFAEVAGHSEEAQLIREKGIPSVVSSSNGRLFVTESANLVSVPNPQTTIGRSSRSNIAGLESEGEPLSLSSATHNSTLHLGPAPVINRNITGLSPAGRDVQNTSSSRSSVSDIERKRPPQLEGPKFAIPNSNLHLHQTSEGTEGEQSDFTVHKLETKISSDILADRDLIAEISKHRNLSSSRTSAKSQ